MLAPRLGDRLEFGIGGLSAFFGEPTLHGKHLVEVEGKPAGARQLDETLTVEVTDVDPLDLRDVGGALGETGEDGAEGEALDDGIGEETSDQAFGVVSFGDTTKGVADP